jgi:hypothetical protein
VQVKEERSAAKVSAETAAELKGRLSALDVQKTAIKKATKSITAT